MSAPRAKIDSIRRHFAPLIGTRISRYRTAEFLHDDGTWSSWPDLPLRLYNDSDAMVAISWSRFDDLWLANDESLPFPLDGALTRWVENDPALLNACLGREIRTAMLGRGQMSIEDREIEIWTRLLIDLNGCWLEIYNALDENGYDLHQSMPDGDFVHCV